MIGFDNKQYDVWGLCDDFDLIPSKGPRNGDPK